MNDEELDLIEGTDAEGNNLTLEVVRYFFYNGEEYVLLRTVRQEGEQTDPALYAMQVNVGTDEDGDEIEEFLPLEEGLMNTLIQAATAGYGDDDDGDDM